MVKVTIKDNSGKPITNFKATADESIGAQAQANGASIPFSCGVGACRSCVGKVTKGKEFLNPEAIGPQHISVEEDEVLTCICGVKTDAPANEEIEIECENL
ncbi:(2Fe-2S)-binding protein [Candidatus Gracilibacteria bacterium]|nr:(2Fe-2S)-binding protein [Candidatus Gracilibacteria bacterium]